MRHNGAGMCPPASNAGFTYLSVLIAVSLIGIGLAITSEVWTKTAEHQKLVQMDWVGEQYVKAIESYYYSNTGSVNFYPPTLEDLTLDKRYLTTKRHIRQLYPNPFTEQVDCRLIAGPSGGVRGVRWTMKLEGATVERQYVFMPQSDRNNRLKL